MIKLFKLFLLSIPIIPNIKSEKPNNICGPIIEVIKNQKKELDWKKTANIKASLFDKLK